MEKQEKFRETNFLILLVITMMIILLTGETILMKWETGAIVLLLLGLAICWLVLEMLEKAIYTSLRRSDVSTRYSSKQVIVILMDANKENGDLVAKRILDCFNKLYTGNRVNIDYGIAYMDNRNKINDMSK